MRIYGLLWTFLGVLWSASEAQRLRAMRARLGHPSPADTRRTKMGFKDKGYDSPVWKYNDYYFIPWDDYIHYPKQIYFSYWALPYDMTINGTSNQIPALTKTPDFRVPEEPALAINYYWGKWYEYRFTEEERYFRLQGFHMAYWQSSMWNKWKQQSIFLMNCYCTMVYRRFIPLAMGAILTYRNILTSAMATNVILSRYKKRKTMMNILGAWYSSDTHYCSKCVNESYYATPARISYHPRWFGPKYVNRSFPIPMYFDLSIWTTTYRMHFDYVDYSQIGYGKRTQTCMRYGTTYNEFTYWTPSTPYPDKHDHKFVIVSTQMVIDQDRKPMPWFRYAFRSSAMRTLIRPCPKLEWGWYFCILLKGSVARLGLEPGAAFHVFEDYSMIYGYVKQPGLAGLATVNIKLRSTKLITYFTVLNRHSVLDWLYDVQKSRIGAEWMDFRFWQDFNKPLKYKQNAQQLFVPMAEKTPMYSKGTGKGPGYYWPIYW